MDRRVHIPVNVKSKNPSAAPAEVEDPAGSVVSDAQAAVTGFQDVHERPVTGQHAPGNGGRPAAGGAAPTEQARSAPGHASASSGDGEWRERALRLQAEMDNFRKRQQRLAQDEIRSERERLLRGFLKVVDDLERALAAPGDGDGLRQGVGLTHRAALQLLQREQVEPLVGTGQPFDPNWHEAVATVDHRRAGVERNTIVEVVESGYRYQDQLLRPAKVIVAV